MQNKTWKRIESNPNLIAFCNRILNYNSILENDITRNMFLQKQLLTIWINNKNYPNEYRFIIGTSKASMLAYSPNELAC